MMQPPAQIEDAGRTLQLVEQLLAEHPPATTPAQLFLEEQFDRGLAWVHHPPGLGGLGLAITLQPAIDAQLALAGAPDPFERNPIGHGMCGPTLAAWGSDAQRAMLRSLFSGEEVWCQLFSEPGAGSDLAGLATRARKDAGEWVVNGQKVWTTMAHEARYGLLIARTDPAVAKHAGMSAFVVDMHAPGVEVRPLVQMTGEAEFNEVFLTDVRLPGDALVGEVGQGWQVAITTLMNERVAIGGVAPPQGSGPVAHLVEAYRGLLVDDPETAEDYTDTVVRLWVRAEMLRLLNLQLGQQRTEGDPGPEGSMSKILAADLNKDIYATLLDVMGPEALLYEGYTMTRPPVAHAYTTPQKAFLRSRANSIEGGTSEVMKNVVAERILGLPGDVRVDRGIAWQEIPRN
ncbi:acyl-CoA dehydrogenase family protein [Spirillospora sp. CA-255316]